MCWYIFPHYCVLWRENKTVRGMSPKANNIYIIRVWSLQTLPSFNVWKPFPPLLCVSREKQNYEGYGLKKEAYNSWNPTLFRSDIPLMCWCISPPLLCALGGEQIVNGVWALKWTISTQLECDHYKWYQSHALPSFNVWRPFPPLLCALGAKQNYEGYEP